MKLKELPKAPIQIQRDNLLIEVEQLKTALLQKDNIIATKSNTVTELQNRLKVQSDLATATSTQLANTQQTLNSKILECNTLNERIATKDLIISEKQNTITQLQNQITVEHLSIQEKEALIVTITREKALLVEEHHKSIEALREQLEDNKLLILQKESSLRELENLNRDQALSMNRLEERVNILNPSYNQLETDLLERDSIIKTLEEDNHKKELVIKEMNNNLLKKDLIVQELENKLVNSEIKTAPAINYELVLLKEQLTDKNLIIELLKSQKAPVFEISDSKILESLDFDNIDYKLITNAPSTINHDILKIENIPLAQSVLLSGDVSLIEEEDSN
jgi:chromosome segregation ATPase